VRSDFELINRKVSKWMTLGEIGVDFGCPRRARKLGSQHSLSAPSVCQTVHTHELFCRPRSRCRTREIAHKGLAKFLLKIRNGLGEWGHYCLVILSFGGVNAGWSTRASLDWSDAEAPTQALSNLASQTPRNQKAAPKKRKEDT
jgi:hypothetical protein